MNILILSPHSSFVVVVAVVAVCFHCDRDSCSSGWCQTSSAAGTGFTHLIPCLYIPSARITGTDHQVWNWTPICDSVTDKRGELMLSEISRVQKDRHRLIPGTQEPRIMTLTEAKQAHEAREELEDTG